MRVSEKTDKNTGTKKKGNLEDVAQQSDLREVFQMLWQAIAGQRSKKLFDQRLKWQHSHDQS